MKMSAIEISEILTSRNSVGGVKVAHEYLNASNKEIKYITFTYTPYNSVGDMVACTVKKRSEIACELTGPIPPNTSAWVFWENVWYNPTVSSAKLTSVKIRYADDTEELLAGEDVLRSNDPKSKMYKMKAEKDKEAEADERKNAIKKKIIWGAVAVVAALLLIAMMRG